MPYNSHTLFRPEYTLWGYCWKTKNTVAALLPCFATWINVGEEALGFYIYVRKDQVVEKSIGIQS